MSQNIRLVMIVKNESSVIERCLKSTLPIVSSYCICDTGSTDDTIEIINRIMAGIPGEVHQRPWLNFAHNRSEAIRLAQEDGKADYLVTLDADEEFRYNDAFKLPELIHDCYRIEMRYNTLVYPRPTIFKASLPWSYKCVCHEFLHLDKPFSFAFLGGMHNFVRCEGSRSRDPQKYIKDADVIRKAMEEDPTSPLNDRYQYYLAQSLKDAKLYKESLVEYQKRADMGGWDEERYMAQTWAARLMQILDYPEDEVTLAYIKAHEKCPRRAEALGNLAHYLRTKNRFAAAAVFAYRAASLPMPGEALFMEPHWYQWMAKDEYAVSSYWSQDFKACYDVCDELIQSGKLPSGEIDRIVKNKNFAQAAMNGAKPC